MCFMLNKTIINVQFWKWFNDTSECHHLESVLKVTFAQLVGYGMLEFIVEKLRKVVTKIREQLKTYKLKFKYIRLMYLHTTYWHGLHDCPTEHKKREHTCEEILLLLHICFSQFKDQMRFFSLSIHNKSIKFAKLEKQKDCPILGFSHVLSGTGAVGANMQEMWLLG